MSASSLRPLRVWDLPTRLFHWLLAATVVGSVASVKLGRMDWHERLGYAVLAMLLFRLVWGVVGGRYARFGAFVRGPGAVLEYLRGVGATHAPGHNPLGALSVLGLIAVLAFQAVSGLFTNDDIAFEGPLARYVSNATSSLLTSLHHRNEWIILGLVGLHVAAIVWYRVARKRDLVGPMIRGDAMLPGEWPASRDDAGLRLRAVAVAAACAGAVWWLVR